MLDFQSIVRTGCAEWGLPVTEEALLRMERFSDLLIEKNRVMNLTAVTEPPEIARRHMLDCLFLLTCMDFRNKRVLDVGSGAGFPCMPLLCYDPSFTIMPLDSTQKRITFIRESAEILGIHVSPMAARAEEAAVPPLRESFDLVTSRAVAPLAVLAELCLPFVKVGGWFLPMKTGGDEGSDELAQAQSALKTLGAVVEERREYRLDGVEKPHQVLLIRKKIATPAAYPRRYSKITAKPL